jgi:hypothetical protein
MIEFNVEKCKTKAAYSAKPKSGKVKIDLGKVRKMFDVLLNTPILLVVKIDGVEMIVHSHGEILFKKCSDLKFMRRVAEKIYSL